MQSLASSLACFRLAFLKNGIRVPQSACRRQRPISFVHARHYSKLRQRQTNLKKPYRRLALIGVSSAFATMALMGLYVYIDDKRNGPLDSWKDRIQRAMHGGFPYRDYIMISVGDITGDGYYHFEEEKMTEKEDHAEKQKDARERGIEKLLMEPLTFKLRLPKDYFVSPGVVLSDDITDFEASALEEGIKNPSYHYDRYLGDLTMEDMFGNHMGLSWWSLGDLDIKTADIDTDLRFMKSRVNGINEALRNQPADELNSTWHSCYIEHFDTKRLEESNHKLPAEVAQCPNMIINVLMKHSPYDTEDRDIGDGITLRRTHQEYVGYLYFMPTKRHLMALRTKYSNNQINYAMASMELGGMGFSEQQIQDKLLMSDKLKNHFRPEVISRMEKSAKKATSNPYLITDQLKTQLLRRYIEFVRDNPQFVRKDDGNDKKQQQEM